MRCVRSPAHLRPRTRAHKLAFTPRIVIDTNSPAHAESSPHVRRTLDINRESDIHAVAGTLQTPISIHTPLAESDSARTARDDEFYTFQSTLPLRGVTHADAGGCERPFISIHTPLAGSDLLGAHVDRIVQPISIHTPLAGSDLTCRPRCLWLSYFNPHSPCGERPTPCRTRPKRSLFQSTLPLRGATYSRLKEGRNDQISIHTPLAGSDPNRPH